MIIKDRQDQLPWLEVMKLQYLARLNTAKSTVDGLRAPF